jgi:uncharacterized SAM-binding protein YcdF (DUF218 family)
VFDTLFLLKKIAAVLLMPLPLALLLVVAGGLLLVLRYRRSGGLLLGLGLLVVFLAAWGPVADALLGSLERRHPPVLDARPYEGIAAVVVLGSGFNPAGSLPITSQLTDSGLIRLNEGIRLYRQLPGARLVLTGGPVFGSAASAHGYAEAALALGVPAEDLVLLDTPRDTIQEAFAVLELLGGGQPLLLVTSASHMPRSMHNFQRVGLAPIPAPTRHKSLREDRRHLAYWVPSALHLRKTERAVYEYMGLVVGGGSNEPMHSEQ